MKTEEKRRIFRIVLKLFGWAMIIGFTVIMFRGCFGGIPMNYG